MSTPTFHTDVGHVVPAVTAEQMREIDRVAIEETGPNLHQMMENAGRSLAGRAMAMLIDGSAERPVVVLAGTGGNGGGGLCAARHLANHGVDVTAVLTNESRMNGVPKDQLATYRATQGKVLGLDQLDGLEPALVIDSIIGYGLKGPPGGASLVLIDWANSTNAPTLALDVPSGLDPTTGETADHHIYATETMTLALPKSGLGVETVGSLWLADLGIPTEAYARVGVDVPPGLFGGRWVLPLVAS